MPATPRAGDTALLEFADSGQGPTMVLEKFFRGDQPLYRDTGSPFLGDNKTLLGTLRTKRTLAEVQFVKTIKERFNLRAVRTGTAGNNVCFDLVELT